ncbi:ABC transporter permease [Catenuloplanes sp. NPDC051500]|uniref:ABC transporter permease n=1 Tax=Catenuloplanes sp. NPDC051500 TaxID=3363959 RepID=UPI0037A88AB4
MTGETTTGAGTLIRLILRRDRVLLPLWTFVLAMLPLSYLAAMAGLFDTDAERAQYATSTAANAADLAMVGPVFGDSVGALGAWRCGVVYVLLALASLLTVVRHTRAEEEAGRRELAGAGVLGRHAPITAALAVVLGANVLLGLIVAFGIQTDDRAGAVALGVALAAHGAFFAAVGAVAAQLTPTAPGARWIAVGVLGISYLLRAAGDSGGAGNGLEWLSWLSPTGLAQRVQPFAGERWWPALLLLGAGLLLVLAAYALSARRDIAAGLLPERLGRAEAARSLRTPVALAWRLHRGALIGWTVGYLVAGAAFGGAARSASDQMSTNANLEEILARIGGTSSLDDAFLASTIAIMGLIASAFGIQAALRLRAEEESGRAEPLLATGVSRVGLLGSHLLFALLGPAVALLAHGLTSGFVFGAATGDVAGQIARMVGAAAAQLPAVWLVTAIAVALFGLLPRLAAVAWGILVACLLLGQVGAVLRLDQRLLDVSPYTHLPHLPGGDVSVPTLLTLSAIAVLLLAAGTLGWRRRDLTG